MNECVHTYFHLKRAEGFFWPMFTYSAATHSLSLSYTPNVLVRLLSSRLQCDSAKGSSYLRWFFFWFFFILDRNRMIKIETTKRDEAMSGMVLTNN